jgi:hypothetical protein
MATLLWLATVLHVLTLMQHTVDPQMSVTQSSALPRIQHLRESVCLAHPTASNVT